MNLITILVSALSVSVTLNIVLFSLLIILKSKQKKKDAIVTISQNKLLNRMSNLDVMQEAGLTNTKIRASRERIVQKRTKILAEYVRKNELQALSDFVQSRCITRAMYGDNGKALWYHALPLTDESRFPSDPDNWELSKGDIREIKRIRKVFDKYIELVQAFYDEAGTLSVIDNPALILPPWVVFPHYSNYTNEWKRGNAKVYYDMFRGFVIGMSQSQKTIYEAVYTQPEYIETDFLHIDDDNE